MTDSPLALAAITVAVVMLTTWLVSLVMRNASIVDIVWGLGFPVVAVTTFVTDSDRGALDGLILAMVLVWGLRLGGYLAWRNLGHGEDYRYRAMRRRWGSRFPLVSLLTVFTLQGTLMWIVSLPVQLSHRGEGRSIGVLAVVGLVVWAIGLAFEAIGDWQLTRFKADPTNAGKVMDRGLWRYTRHPNYFGDSCVWWGIAITAATVPVARWGLIGAVVMNVLLVRVSGKALLERSLSKRKDGWAEYAARTSGFIPRPPRA
jgi:steroid 5-alpha reductase family enzyme